jgi:putative ABC transport system substrate-binding protein
MRLRLSGKTGSTDRREWGNAHLRHGALYYSDSIIDDAQPGKVTSFPQAVQLKDGEVIALAWVVYKNKEDRDRINKAVMEDPQLKESMDPRHDLADLLSETALTRTQLPYPTNPSQQEDGMAIDKTDAAARTAATEYAELTAMWLIRVAVSLTVALTLAILPAHGQQTASIPRLCFLTFDPGTPQANRFNSFFQGLRDLGYADGQTISIDYLSADGQGERFPALAADCLRLKADIIVVTSTPAAKAAKNATRTIPIVMIALGDPVGTGLVDSLARPGANVTGQSFMAPGLAAKRLELLKEAVPRITRVLVLSYLTDPISTPQINELKTVAPSLGVKLQIHEIKTVDDFPAAFEAGIREGAEGLLTTVESIFFVHRARVIELAARHRLPAMYPLRIFVDAGGLMAYTHNSSDLYKRAATYVDRILKGAKPADLPIQQPTAFELLINLNTAKALGLTIPPSLRLRADQLIE